MNRAERILKFWFGDRPPERPTREQLAFWFAGEEKTDRLIRKKFESDLQAAIRGELDSWATTPHGRLALIILLDQFSRNIYRDTPQEVAQDAKALDLSLRGLEKGDDLNLRPIEKLFFYLPMEHAEDLEMQKKSISVFEKLVQSLPADLKPHYQTFLDYAHAHFKIIERFGHFPYQNEVCGRTSTPEEIEFLNLPGAPFFL